MASEAGLFAGRVSSLEPAEKAPTDKADGYHFMQWGTNIQEQGVSLTGRVIDDTVTGRDSWAGIWFLSNGEVQETLGVNNDTKFDDLIVPNGDADNTYEVRIINVVHSPGGSFDAQSAGEGSWTNLGGNRRWAVGDSTGFNKTVTFTAQIRKDGGAVLASAEYTLIAIKQ